LTDVFTILGRIFQPKIILLNCHFQHNKLYRGLR